MTSSRLTAVVAILLLGAPSAFAHRLLVEATVTGEQLRVDAYYDDGTPAQDAKITVQTDEKTVAEGRTDAKGVWTCPKPGPGTYTIRAQSAGHPAKDTLVIADPGTASSDREFPDVPAPSAPPESPKRAEATRTPWGRLALGIGIIAGVSLVSLILRRAFARQIQPR